MKSLTRDSITLATAAFFLCIIQSASATDWFVKTQNFSTSAFHEDLELNATSTTGLAIGWSIYSVVVVITGIAIFVATWKNNSEYTRLLEEDIAKIKSLGMNLEKINEEFEIMQKGGV